jgi:hypothetical protein
VLAVVTSCAETNVGTTAAEDASTLATVQDAGLEAGDAASNVALCDAGDPACVSDPIPCDAAAWCPMPAPLNPSFLLTSVWGWSENDVLAVGSGGTVLRWNGTSWINLPSPSGKDTFFTVWGTSANDIWLVSGTNALFHASMLVNGQPDWKAAPNLTNDPSSVVALRAIWGSGAGDLRVGGEPFFVNTPDGFVGHNQFVRAGAGEEWVPIEGAGTVYGIWGSSATDIWLVVDNSGTNPWQKGMTLHGTGSTPNTLVFAPVDSQTASGLVAVWGSSADDVWAVGEHGAIRHITPGAKRWEVVPSPTKTSLQAIWGSGPGDIWAVGVGGTILHYDGTAWTSSQAAFPVGPKPDLYGVWGSGAGDVWIVGDGIVLRSTQGRGKTPVTRGGS